MERNIQLKSARDILLFLLFLRATRIEEKAKVCVKYIKKNYNWVIVKRTRSRNPICDFFHFPSSAHTKLYTKKKEFILSHMMSEIFVK